MFAIIVAAGRGRRMGGDKALLSVAGRTLVERHVAAMLAVGCMRVEVVVRPEIAGRVAAMFEGRAEVHVSAADEATQGGSLGVGVRAIVGPGDDGVGLVTPVDLLPPDRSTIAALLAAMTPGVLAATPTCGGRGGHPIAVRGELLAPYRVVSDAPPALHDLLEEAGARRVRVVVEDVRVLGDLDTPAQVLALDVSGRGRGTG